MANNIKSGKSYTSSVKYTNNTKAKSKKDQDLIQILMGDDVAPRKNFIINRALEVLNLDI